MIDERDGANQTKRNHTAQPSSAATRPRHYPHKPSIIFFGSGPVAAKSLELLSKDFAIEAIVTKPVPAHHRGDFPVITLAEKLGLKTLFASSKDELDDLFASSPVTSRAAVLIDFGIIVSQKVIDYFPLGIINSHFSLLPEWRGADPISFAILSGQKQTGVSLMLLVEAMDEGPLLAQAPYDIPADATTPSLTEVLIDLSNECLKNILPLWLDGKTQPAPQEEVTMAASKEPTYSRKLTKQDGILDWNKPAEQLEREIRAYIDWPKSRTELAGKEVIITGAHAVPSDSPDDKPGHIEYLSDVGVIMVTTSGGSLCIDTLKPAGKKGMPVKAFLAGYGKNLS